MKMTMITSKCTQYKARKQFKRDEEEIEKKRRKKEK